MKWEKIDFGDLYQLPSKNGLNRPSRVRGSGYKMINMGELFANDRIKDIPMELVLLNDREIETSNILVNDLLFARQSLIASGAGKCSIVLEAPEITTFESHLIRVRLNEEKSNPLFYYYYFKTPFANMKSLVQQGVQAGIRGSELKFLKVINPPLPTQRKIASILSAYDDLIENNLKRIKLLEEQAFLTYKVIVSSEKLQEFTIEELANVVMGQSPTSDTYTDESDNLPFHQGVTNFSNYFVTHKIYCRAPIKIAELGDILFSVRAPVGRINFTTDRICIGRGLCAFRSKKGFQNYLYHQLKEFFFAEDVIGNGAIFNAVTKVELMKVKLKTPSDKIQKEFEIEAQQTYNLILNLSKQNTKLREARDILLPKLMNGQIEV